MFSDLKLTPGDLALWNDVIVLVVSAADTHSGDNAQGDLFYVVSDTGKKLCCARGSLALARRASFSSDPDM